MVFVKEGHPKSAPIEITYYVSPHEFWFKYENDHDETAEDELMQRRIDRLAEESRSDRNNNALKVGDIVIAQCIPMNLKYIRARIDYVFTYATGTEFVLWAIDYGFPIRSSPKLLTRVTSNDLKGDNRRVYKATCNGIVPAQPDYDFINFKNVMRQKPHWSEKAIKEFEKMYSASEKLIFHYDCSAAEQHVYGYLEAILCSGKSVNMNETLKGIDEAVDSTDFQLEDQSLVHKDYWFQQENYKILENVYSASNVNLKALKPKNSQDQSIVDKVTAWNSASPATKVQEIALNKRYSQCSKPVASTSTTSCKIEKMSSKKEEVHQLPVSSFGSDRDASVVSKSRFKKVLWTENFSTRQPSRVLAHCRIGLPAEPVSSIADVNFADKIKENCKKMNIIETRRIQSVAWPHLMRGHSLIVINAAKTGKTLTYLPAVCSLAMEYETVVDGDGPVAIIICLDSNAVNDVMKICEKLLKSLGVSVKAFSLHDDENIQECQLLNGMDILVTTIPNLLRLIQSPLRLFNAKRLARIVFDDMDSMYERFGEQNVQKIFNSLCTPGRQFIVTSKIWDKRFKKFCEKDDLMLCIGAYVEAAIYSNINMTVHVTSKEDHYRNFLDNFKKGKYFDEQTVIVCSEPYEVHMIEKNLRLLGYPDITYCHDRVDTETIGRINQEISRKNTGALGVLVCTDDTLGDLNIRNAKHIIHYSLPINWTIFTQRFVASFDYYENMVVDGFPAERPTSIVYVDEQSLDTMPRLVDFMKNRCSVPVPEHILRLANNQRIQQVEQIKTYIPFCSRMKLFGVCDISYNCNARHFLTDSDRAAEHFPRNGKVKFEILTVHSPAHFTVRLLEHCPVGRNEWRKPYFNDVSTLRLQLNKHFENQDNLIFHHPQKLHDLCIIEDDDESEKFKRCQIIFLHETSKEKMVWLIDTNVIQKCLKSQDLYVLPDKFKCYPPQAVDIRITGVVPLDQSSTWDKNLMKHVTKWCELNENCHFEGTIEMTAMRCIWVKSVKIIEKLPSIDEELVKFDFKKEIVSGKLGYPDDNAFPLLRDMAKRAGLVDSEPMDDKPVKAKPTNTQRLNTPPIKTPPLNTPPLNTPLINTQPISTSPIVHEPDILRTPVQRVANDQERGRRGRGKDLQSPVPALRSPTSTSPSVVSEYDQSSTLSRSILSKSTENDHSNQQRPLVSTKTLRKLFKWEVLPFDRFVEVDIGQFFTPDRVYVLLASEFESFQQLRVRIWDFTIKPDNLKPLIDVEVGSICLAFCQNENNDNNNNDYRRAQIIRHNQSEVSIFLVDYGEEKHNVNVGDLFQIPDKFITSLPFQAILCNMVGIRSNEFDDACWEIYQTLVNFNSLFVRCTGSHSVSNDLIKCNAYDAVFIDKNDEQIINDLVVMNGFADYDPETKHLIDVKVEDFFELACLHKLLQSLVENNNRVEQPATSSLDPMIESNPTTAPTKTDRMPEVHNTPPKPHVTYRLESPAKMPHIVWKQTESMVQITISAPEVKDYSLKIRSRSVQFRFIINKEPYEDVLSLFGCVDAKYTSHEVRGLNIVIKLKKTLAAEKWPRLEKWPGKNHFVKCVDECDINDEKTETQQRKFLPIAHDTDSPSSEATDDDDDNEALLNSLEI